MLTNKSILPQEFGFVGLPEVCCYPPRTSSCVRMYSVYFENMFQWECKWVLVLVCVNFILLDSKRFPSSVNTFEEALLFSPTEQHQTMSYQKTGFLHHKSTDTIAGALCFQTHRSLIQAKQNRLKDIASALRLSSITLLPAKCQTGGPCPNCFLGVIPWTTSACFLTKLMWKQN